jgi:hypothetical protein
MTGEPDVAIFSCTGAGVTISRRSGQHFHVKVVAIVIGLDEASLESAAKESFLGLQNSHRARE